MLSPYSRSRSPRPRCLADDWAGTGWTLLERHELAVTAPPATALAAVAGLRLGELRAVQALFSLRRLRHSADMTLREFFSTPPFAALAEDPGRELVFGVLRPSSEVAGEPGAAMSPGAFASALRTARFAAVVTFRSEPRADGSMLWTETWVRTRGARARAAFAAYWLVIGPWSAWIRRMILQAARAHAERAVRPDDEIPPERSGACVRVTVSTHIDAAAERVLALYANPARWSRLFPATIRDAREVHAEGGERLVEVQHRREGTVMNRLRQVSARSIALEESKRRYDATFVSEFTPEPGGMRYTLHGAVRLKGGYRLLSRFVKPIVRAQMRRYAVEPLRIAAEQDARRSE